MKPDVARPNNLPLPGDRGPALSLSARHRSTEALAVSNHPTIPVPHDYQPPSRNHSYDEAAGLMNSMNAMSISGPSSAYESHLQHSGLTPATDPNAQYHSNDQAGRPHRHSFSIYSAYPPKTAQYPSHMADQEHFDQPTNPSISPGFSNPHERTNGDHHVHNIHAAAPPLTPSVHNSGRRPLPIPGLDTANRPTSAWGDYSSQGLSNTENPISPQYSAPGHYQHAEAFSGAGEYLFGLSFGLQSGLQLRLYFTFYTCPSSLTLTGLGYLNPKRTLPTQITLASHRIWLMKKRSKPRLQNTSLSPTHSHRNSPMLTNHPDRFILRPQSPTSARRPPIRPPAINFATVFPLPHLAKHPYRFMRCIGL